MTPIIRPTHFCSQAIPVINLHNKIKCVPEAYIKIIQDMYEDCETQVTTREGNTDYFTGF